MVSAAEEQLDDLVAVLEARGMPVRDVLITVGNEILEATMSYRSRWFEYLAYRPLLETYYREDAAMRWRRHRSRA